MANVAALATIYNHYMSNYVSKSSSPYDTHKKSELRRIYNSMIKQNTTAPLAILDKSKSAQEFAVGVKEEALSLRNTIASISGLNINELANKRLASSSNENIATAKYIGQDLTMEENPSFDIEVLDLASPQINTGNYLSHDKIALKENTYSFDISINDLNYEFQYTINEGETNQNIQERLVRLIKRANIGLTASIDEDTDGNTSLIIESKATGYQPDNAPLFIVSDHKTTKEKGSVSYFGLNTITSNAKGATIKLNGDLQLPNSNTFTVEKSFEISLHGLGSAEGETTTISLKKNSESILEHIKTLTDGYNRFLENTKAYTESHPKAQRIISDMQNISALYENELDSLGISVSDSGSISLQNSLLEKSTQTEDLNETFAPLNSFTQSILNKINQVSLNPMEYTNKTIVAYKNPSNSLASPYTPSAYSGMMFNSYC
jgi:flagellar hook-associated protein 2